MKSDPKSGGKQPPLRRIPAPAPPPPRNAPARPEPPVVKRPPLQLPTKR